MKYFRTYIQPPAPLGAPHILCRGWGLLQEGAAGQDDGVHVWPVPDPRDREASQENRAAELLRLRQGGHQGERHLAPEVALTLHGGFSHILRMEEALDESGENEWCRNIFSSCVIFQSRVRECLVNLLNTTGQKVGLPKSPSVSEILLIFVAHKYVIWNVLVNPFFKIKDVENNPFLDSNNQSRNIFDFI